ncbi:MAG: hypothetical protein HeimC3_11750 [Candidatus Heimdallarchaeota archaeon LC_3]|nr:MAG: hypothetical protein HeimC3_11750 [Candidatus Heimdallarchaeota archaeon LC_3]
MPTCQIESCTNESNRTMGKSRITEALKEEKLELSVRSKVTKIKICKEHYRRIKKHIKKKDKIERLRWGI